MQDKDLEESLPLLSQQHPHTSTCMAHRTKLQTFGFVLLSDNFVHLVFILALFIGTTAVYDHAQLDWLFQPNTEHWFAVYSTANLALKIELFIFGTVFFARFIIDVHHTEDGTRQEDSFHKRILAFVAALVNVGIATGAIFGQLYIRNVADRRDRHQSHGLITQPHW